MPLSTNEWSIRRRVRDHELFAMATYMPGLHTWAITIKHNGAITENFTTEDVVHDMLASLTELEDEVARVDGAE